MEKMLRPCSLAPDYARQLPQFIKTFEFEVTLSGPVLMAAARTCDQKIRNPLLYPLIYRCLYRRIAAMLVG